MLEIVDRGIEHGTLAARPDDKACDWCSYRAVCGPFEFRRTHRKPAALHADLDQLLRYPRSSVRRQAGDNADRGGRHP